MTDSSLSGETNNVEAWPSLPFEEWKETCATLHMWSQVVGKIRLALTPLVNHWWNVPLYVSPRGLTTSSMHHGGRVYEIQFDFVSHQLLILSSDGAGRAVALTAQPVAVFYEKVMRELRALGVGVEIWTTPVEIPDPIPFEKDFQHASYDPEYARRFWLALARADRVFNEFRSRFVGKCSPVHFFWGSFDLAVTRFSGRPAPEREGADAITREAYSHEVISHGFWPGGPAQPAAFYSYTAPEPPGLKEAAVRPAEAFYSTEMSEFLLPYEAVRLAGRPEEALADFLQSTYEAGANLAGWDRASLERTP